MFKLLAFLMMVAITAVVVTSEASGRAGPRLAAASATVSFARAAMPTPPAGAARRRRCDRNYSGRCLRPNVYDYDCAGGSGDGPRYVGGPFRVVGYDRYGLDSDGDGVACES